MCEQTPTRLSKEDYKNILLKINSLSEQIREKEEEELDGKFHGEILEH